MSEQQITPDKLPVSHLTCPFHDSMGQRMQRVESALYGDPNDERSTALLPTMRRLQAYMDAACWMFRAVLASIPAAGATVAIGRAIGWW